MGNQPDQSVGKHRGGARPWVGAVQQLFSAVGLNQPIRQIGLRRRKSALPWGGSGAAPLRGAWVSSSHSLDLHLFKVGGLVLAVAFLLSACVAQGYRDPGAGISSTTRFDLARMAGDWRVVERFGDPADPNARQPERYVFGGDTVTRHWWTCNDWAKTPNCVDLEEVFPVTVTGPGRIEIAGRALWVLWVDDGFRTAAIGHPSGGYGWIMERGPGAVDRRNAAREILAWAGYDLTRLVEVSE